MDRYIYTNKPVPNNYTPVYIDESELILYRYNDYASIPIFLIANDLFTLYGTPIVRNWDDTATLTWYNNEPYIGPWLCVPYLDISVNNISIILTLY